MALTPGSYPLATPLSMLGEGERCNVIAFYPPLTAMANITARSAWEAVGLKHPDYAEHKARLKAPPLIP